MRAKLLDDIHLPYRSFITAFLVTFIPTEVCSVVTWQHLQDLRTVIGLFALFEPLIYGKFGRNSFPE